MWSKNKEIKRKMSHYLSKINNVTRFIPYFLTISFMPIVFYSACGKKDYGTYMMLGARNSKISRLIFTETIVVGLLAAVLGIIVGIGLTQVVSELLISQLGLQNPYDKIWIPFTIFLVLYVIYYLITVKLYEGIVLKNR
jgi:multisubunit Na+/H+ antiporter MnhB subunit